MRLRRLSSSVRVGMATAITTVTATGHGVTGKRVIAAGITTAAGMAAGAATVMAAVTAVVMEAVTAVAVMAVAVMAVAATIVTNACVNGPGFRNRDEARPL